LFHKDLLWRIVRRPTRFIMARSGIYFSLRIAQKKLEFLESTLLLENQSKDFLKFIGYLKGVGGSDYNFSRVGSKNDGGYLLLDSFSNIGLCISLGIGENLDFEQQLLKKGIPVLAVDGTISTLPTDIKPDLKWIKKNVGAADSDTQISINTLFALSEEFFSWSGDCLLKIDIEGHEYSAIKALGIENQKLASQIVIELHDVIPMLYHSPSEINGVIEKLLETHVLVHLHGNNYDFSITFENFTLPNVLELSFARRDFVNAQITSAKFPRDLDAPNNQFMPEIIINL
jgi:hypothetical protein